MGLSLRNITHKIGDVLGGAERQINPFDNGVTYFNPVSHAPAPPSIVKQAQGFGTEFGRQLLGTGADVSNFVGNAEIKGAQALMSPLGINSLGFGPTTYRGPQTNAQQFNFNVPGTTTNTGRFVTPNNPRNFAANVTGAPLMVASIPTGGLGGLAEKGVEKFLPEATSNVVKFVAPKLATVPVEAGTAAGNAALSGADKKDILKAAGTGAEFAGLNVVKGARTARAVNKSEFFGGENAAGYQEALKNGTVFRGAVDSKPRFEGSDVNAGVYRPNMDEHGKPQANVTYSLDSLLQHDELFNQYPDLRNVHVTVAKIPDEKSPDGGMLTTLGAYSPSQDRILVNKNIAGDAEKLKETLLHETQHAIQKREAFSVGSSPKKAGSFDKYQSNPSETESRVVEGRSPLSPAQQAANPVDNLGNPLTPDKYIKSGPPQPGDIIRPTETPTKIPVTFANARRVGTGIPEIDKAISDLKEHYGSKMETNGNGLLDVTEAAHGKARAGGMLAQRLWKSLRKNLSEEEDRAVYDKLQGVDNPNLTPKAAKVAAALKPIYTKALDIRREVNPNVNKVHDYAPRILKNTLGNAVRGSSGVLGKIKSVLDLGNLNSPFSKNRQVGKFVGKNGKVLYGRASELGLTRHEDGTLSNGRTGKNKVVFKQVSTNTHELEQNLGSKYMDKAGHVSGIYHADTASLQARHSALNELNAHPNEHGLYTRDQVESGNLQNMRELSVPGLKDANGENFFANNKEGKLLERDRMFGHPDSRGIPAKVYDAVSNTATQFIVLNPLFHGANQLVQSGIAAGNIPKLGRGVTVTGWGRLVKGVLTANKDDVLDYVSQPHGYIPDYGSSIQNIVSKATGGATKLPSKTMAGIELKLRVGLYKASVEGGMSKADAIKNINKFLGDDHQISRVAQRMTLFGHYFKTMTGALYDQGRHPIKNAGANVNTALIAGLLYGATVEYQKYTGNKKAYVRMPGELGILKEGVKSVGELKQGEVPTILTNRINPVLKETGQQIFNKDLFTNKPVTDTGRVKHAVSSLVAPAQQVGYATSGKRSRAEIGENQLGLYTPHAKGYQATSNPQVSFLNTPKALKGNGMASQEAYFNGLKTAQKSVAGDTKSQAQFTDYLARSHDKATGASIQNNPAQSLENSRSLFDNGKLRNTVHNFEKSQPSHDPMWNLTDQQLKDYMQYKSQYTGDAAKTILREQNDAKYGKNWTQNLADASSNFYNNLPHIAGSKLPISQSPPYPKFSQSTQKLLDAYNADGADKTALMQSNGGELSDAFNKIAIYTNAMRKAEGAPQKNNFPVADKQTNQIMKFYNSLPTHDGSKGGNAARYAWGQVHPQEYAKMQAYLTKATLFSLENEASKAQYLGQKPSQKLLKDISSLGKYDVVKKADGTYAVGSNDPNSPSYIANPFSSSSNYSSSNYRSSAQYKDARYLSNSEKLRVRGTSRGRIKRSRISLKSGVGQKVAKFKVSQSLPTKGKSSLKLKPSRV